MAISIVDDTPDFIVVDKPSGINFHDEGDISSGLFNQIKLQSQSPELYPVHRLDKMTSGLIIFAKNLSAAQQFQQLFESHQVEKFYLALSDLKPKKKQGLIKGDMVKSRRGMWKLLRAFENPALTQFFSYHLSNGLRLFLLKPHSGKTHQIRVALASIGSAILGDNRYHSKQAQERGYLHAYALKFTIGEKSYSYVCKPKLGEHFLTEHCQLKLLELSEPWQLKWPKVK